MSVAPSTQSSAMTDFSRRSIASHCPHILWQNPNSSEAALMEIPEGCTEVTRWVDLPNNLSKDYAVRRDPVSGLYFLTSACKGVSVWALVLHLSGNG